MVIGMAFGPERLDVFRAAIEYVNWKSTGRITSTPIPIPIPIPIPKEYHARHSSALARPPAPELISTAAGGRKDCARRHAQSKIPSRSAHSACASRAPPPVANQLPDHRRPGLLFFFAPLSRIVTEHINWCIAGQTCTAGEAKGSGKNWRRFQVYAEVEVGLRLSSVIWLKVEIMKRQMVMISLASHRGRS